MWYSGEGRPSFRFNLGMILFGGAYGTMGSIFQFLKFLVENLQFFSTLVSNRNNDQISNFLYLLYRSHFILHSSAGKSEFDTEETLLVYCLLLSLGTLNN